MTERHYHFSGCISGSGRNERETHLFVRKALRARCQKEQHTSEGLSHAKVASCNVTSLSGLLSPFSLMTNYLSQLASVFLREATTIRWNLHNTRAAKPIGKEKKSLTIND